MKLLFNSKKKGKLILKIILLSVFIYFVALFVKQRMLIHGRQKKIQELKEQISVQEVKIGKVKSELEDISSSDLSRLKSIAHKDLNVCEPGERVFKTAKGN